jgi:hypothetical protein
MSFYAVPWKSIISWQPPFAKFNCLFGFAVLIALILFGWITAQQNYSNAN